MPISDSLIDRTWDADIVPQLTDYIRIPAKSPHFDPRLGGATATSSAWSAPAEAWVRAQPVRGLAVEIVRLPGPHAGALLRRAGDRRRRGRAHGAALRPPRQAARDDRLARRARAVDAGAARTASSTAAAAPTTATRCSRRSRRSARCRRRASPHARCVGLIETCEESGSYDLPAYLDALAPRIGRVDFVVGLDSGCGDYERLWVDDVAARPRRRHADGRGADRGRALGRRERRRAVVVPHRARSCSTASRTRRPAAILPADVPRADSRRARRAGARPRPASSATSSCASIPFAGTHAADGRPTAPRRC